MMKIRSIHILFLLVVGQWSLAQSFLDHVSLEDGLSQSQIRCILQDSRGYMWFGAQHGLNRYDGYEMEHYYRNPFDSTSLSSDDISVLYEDSQQRIWVGTRLGLNLYDPIEDHFIRYDSIFVSHQLAGQQITAIAEDRWQTIWVGTLNGLWRFIPNGKSFDPIRYETDSVAAFALNSNQVGNLVADQKGNIWFGTNQGLTRVMVENPAQLPQNQKIKFLHADNSDDPVLQQINFPVFRLFVDQNNRIWLSARHELFRLNPAKNEVLELTGQLDHQSTMILAMLVDRFGELWLGTLGEGIFRYRIQDSTLQLTNRIRENAFVKNGLKSNYILHLYESKKPDADIVWIGTRDAGVQLFSRSKNSFEQWDQILAQENKATATSVFSICTDSYGDLWVGTYEGLFRIDRQTKQYKKYLMQPGYPAKNEHHAILEDSRQELWIGSNEGLYKYDRKRDRFNLVPLPTFRGMQPAIAALYEDREQNLWIGTPPYLLKMNSQTGEQDMYSKALPEHDENSLTAVNNIQEDQDGNLWFGTNDGLVLHNPIADEFIRFQNNPNDPTSLIDNLILDVYCTPEGQLWICSPRGLSKLLWEKGRAKFHHYTEQDGLPNSFVYSALPDDQGRLWLSTNGGLSCFDPATKTFRNYDAQDGFAGREFNSGAFHRSQNGELFFGGLGVLVSFRPDQMVENEHLPRLAITSFRKMKDVLSLDSLLAKNETVRLNYKERIFSFQLSALDFTNPAKNEYAYHLKGSQDHWVDMGTNRYLSFAQLAPGEYTLEIKASNNQGRWNERDLLSIPIVITPPFWRTWWFYSLTFLFIGVLTFSAYRYRVQMKVERAVELERVKLEENERVRKLAAQDLHDEFGNTLTRISLLTELIKAKSNGNGNGEVKNLLTKISDNANRMYQGTKDFIWAINPEHDSFYEVAVRLKDFGDDAFDKTGINFRVGGIEDKMKSVMLPMGASRHLVMLFKEAMSNTLKHAAASEVCLTFQINGENAEISWQDNGVGFDLEHARGGNGLQNMRSRAKRIDADLQLASEANNGTKVTVAMQAQSMTQQS